MGSAGVGVWGSGDERRGGASLSPSPWLWRGGELRRGNALRDCGGGGLGLGGAVEWRVRKSGAVRRRHGDGRSGGREVEPSAVNGGGFGAPSGSEGEDLESESGSVGSERVNRDGSSPR